MIDVVEILQHWQAGRPKTQIAASVGADRETVRKYVAPAVAAGIKPGGPVLTRAEWAVLVAGWFPGLVDAQARSHSYPELHGFRSLIEPMLGVVTVTTAWQRLRDEHGLEAGLTSFRTYVHREFPVEKSSAGVTVWRPPVAPGSEAQIDYGLLGRWLDPVTEKMRRVWAFVMVLACSRHMFVRPVLTMDAWSWLDCHVRAFEYFGGIPERLVPDNLRTGVEKSDLYDPKSNRSYAELAEHYGCLIDPARVFKPKDKARVERPMPYVRDSFWRGREWPTLSGMQAGAIEWCTNVAGQRHHRGLDGSSPLSVFVTVEKPVLKPLPQQVFEPAVWSRPKVAPDCHVVVGGALYSVPWKHQGLTVDARLCAKRLEVFADTLLIKTHVRILKGRSTDLSDYPPEKTAFYQQAPLWCRTQASIHGPATAAVIDELLGVNAMHRLRSCQGILRLAEKHTTGRLEAACHRALQVGDPSYRTIKGILVAGTETTPEPAPKAPSAPAHLHGANLLFNPDQIDQIGEVA